VRPGSYTDPDHEQTYLRLGAGPDGRQALIHDSTTAGHVWIGTHKIADPKWQGPDGAALVIEVLSKADNTLTVSVTEHEFLPGMKVYAATVTLPASPQWQTVTLHLADMKTDKGEALAAWSRVTNLELRSETWRGEGPTITGVRWVR
jgi:hypothetical protein